MPTIIILITIELVVSSSDKPVQAAKKKAQAEKIVFGADTQPAEMLQRLSNQAGSDLATRSQLLELRRQRNLDELGQSNSGGPLEPYQASAHQHTTERQPPLTTAWMECAITGVDSINRPTHSGLLERKRAAQRIECGMEGTTTALDPERAAMHISTEFVNEPVHKTAREMKAHRKEVDLQQIDRTITQTMSSFKSLKNKSEEKAEKIFQARQKAVAESSMGGVRSQTKMLQERKQQWINENEDLQLSHSTAAQAAADAQVLSLGTSDAPYWTMDQRYVHSPMFRSARVMNDMLKIHKKPEVHTFSEHQRMPTLDDAAAVGKRTVPFFDPYERPASRPALPSSKFSKHKTERGALAEKITNLGNNMCTTDIILSSAKATAPKPSILKAWRPLGEQELLENTFPPEPPKPKPKLHKPSQPAPNLVDKLMIMHHRNDGGFLDSTVVGARPRVTIRTGGFQRLQGANRSGAPSPVQRSATLSERSQARPGSQ